MSNTRLSAGTDNPDKQSRTRAPSIDLQQRTLRVTNIDSQVTKKMLYELFSQAGPVVNVVHKPGFAFIEFEDEDSVGYAMALLRGISLYGTEVQMQPKLANRHEYYKYLNTLNHYEMTVACNPYEWWQRFGSCDHPMPNYLCRGAINQNPMPPPMQMPTQMPIQVPMQQPVQIPHFANHAVQPNVPHYPPHHFDHSYESFQRNRYSSPDETPYSRGNHNDYVNGRYGERYSPYSRPAENRYRDRDDRYSHSQSYNERSHRDAHWRHRRSN